MKVVLHEYWRSSASYRVRIALALKGIAYHRAPVDLMADAQRSPDHLTMNPQGLVPVLQIDGLVLTQSLAIIEYLDETRLGPRLLPLDPTGRARVRALSQTVASEIHPISNLRVLKRVEALGGSMARERWNTDNIRSGLASFETLLAKGATGCFCHGEGPTMADCVLIPQLYNASRWGVDYSHLPRIVAVARNCATLPAFAAAHPDCFDPDKLPATDPEH